MPTSTLRECLASPNFDINEMTKGRVTHFSLDRTNHLVTHSGLSAGYPCFHQDGLVCETPVGDMRYCRDPAAVRQRRQLKQLTAAFLFQDFVDCSCFKLRANRRKAPGPASCPPRAKQTPGPSSLANSPADAADAPRTETHRRNNDSVRISNGPVKVSNQVSGSSSWLIWARRRRNKLRTRRPWQIHQLMQPMPRGHKNTGGTVILSKQRTSQGQQTHRASCCWYKDTN